MKHKLNYTVEVSSKLTTLFIFFILRIRERKLVCHRRKKLSLLSYYFLCYVSLSFEYSQAKSGIPVLETGAVFICA